MKTMKQQTEKNRKQPFGYGVQEGLICCLPAEAETVQEIYRLYIKGISIAQIAKAITARGVPYRQGVPEWNKNMVARILDDSRYTGQPPYPAILEQKFYDQVCRLRQKNRSRQLANQEIRWIRAKVSCAQCGTRLIRKADKRRRGTIWCCPQCAMTTRPVPDDELVQLITSKLAAAADALEHSRLPEPGSPITLQELCLRREFDRALYAPQPDVEQLLALSQKITVEAYQRSQCSSIWLTAQIRNRLLAWQPDMPLKQEVFEAVVSKILLTAEAGIQIQLTNQQIL